MAARGPSLPLPPPTNGIHHANHNHEEKKIASAKEKSIQWGSRSVDIFEKIDQIGEGTYGYVIVDHVIVLISILQASLSSA
jgi:hypothetical protein